jgi:hypothetical protein
MSDSQAQPSPEELYRKNWDLAFGSKQPTQAQTKRAQKGDHQASDKSDSIAPTTVTTLHSNSGTQPQPNTTKKCRRPNPWLEFSVQAALCLFTLGAFVAASWSSMELLLFFHARLAFHKSH